MAPYSNYAVLHHPEYRERDAANLRRRLPRIPFAPVSSVPPCDKDVDVFRALVNAGQRLAEIHVHYEQQPEHPLTRREKAGEKLNWRVTRMRVSKNKTTLIYNDFLTLSEIPKETYDYRLGNRSALEWVIDQYQVLTDKRSGITNDPNREDDPQYIMRLMGQVITVSADEGMRARVGRHTYTRRSTIVDALTPLRALEIEQWQLNHFVDGHIQDAAKRLRKTLGIE